MKSPKDLRHDIEELKEPLMSMDILQSSSHRTHNRRLVDRMQRAQRRHRRRTKLALIVLADPEADGITKAAAHRQLDEHRKRITALERTHGRAIEREVVSDMRQTAARSGDNRKRKEPGWMKTGTPAPHSSKPYVPHCKFHQKVLGKFPPKA